MMCSKILNNLVSIDSDMFFKRSSSRHTRVNRLKLSKCRTVSARGSRIFRQPCCRILCLYTRSSSTECCQVNPFARQLIPVLIVTNRFCFGMQQLFLWNKLPDSLRDLCQSGIFISYSWQLSFDILTSWIESASRLLVTDLYRKYFYRKNC